MEKRRLEKLGIEPSLLGYGCMRFPMKEDKTIDEEKAQALLDKAIAEGVPRAVLIRSTYIIYR